MSANYSSIDLLGYVGNDPEEFITQGGTKGARFSLAVNQVWNDASGQRHEETDWFRVVAWGNVAETCLTYLSKGRQVFVTGKPRMQRWTDKEGAKQERMQVQADQVIFLDRPESDDDN